MNSIVFVHGLRGHPETTWTCNAPTHLLASASSDRPHKDDVHLSSDGPPRKKPRFGLRNGPKELVPKVFWPRGLLPEEIPNARILTWGYDVDIVKLAAAASQATILQHAETLLSDLAQRKRKPLIFIAHSLGGIVVKDALNTSKIAATFAKEIVSDTRGVIFLGTPHRGSAVASLGKVISGLARVAFQNPNPNILSALEKDSDTFERISNTFRHVLASGRINIHSFQEELQTHGISIVDASSSRLGDVNESISTLHANHQDMVKFSTANDPNFKRVVSVLRRWVDEINESQPAPSQSLSLDTECPTLPDGEDFSKKYQECLGTLNDPVARWRLDGVESTYENTYEWLFDPKVDFAPWLESKISESIYWIRGKPASGKSTLMKFAMNHGLTSGLFFNYSNCSWITAGYFFHDRGEWGQKSVKGFLQEILYQMLSQRRNLFSLVYSTFSRLRASQRSNSTTWERRSMWSLEQLREALLSIGTKSTSTLNCCLFVDALDEHDGKHTQLISILKDLARLPENLLFRMRLCVAGRPENVFTDAFQTCPGLAIQDYTTADIRHFAKDEIHKDYRGVLDDEGKKKVAFLIEEIVRKANGVFLWVRLAVDEIVDGICRGATLDELKILLFEIPPELEGLYTRAIRRVRRGPKIASNIQRYETYVMFQIAIFANQPMRSSDFLNATAFLTILDPGSKRAIQDETSGRLDDTSADLSDATGSFVEGIVDPLPGSIRQLRSLRYSSEILSRDEMQRRFNNKSAGLLEVESRGRNPIVQFIHQTAKEFILTKKGKNLISENLNVECWESGNLMILRYIISRLAYEEEFAITEFQEHAQAVEIGEGRAIGPYLGPVVESMADRNRILSRINYRGNPEPSEWLNQVSGVHSRDGVQMLLFYIIYDLDLSLDLYLMSHLDDIDPNIPHSCWKRRSPFPHTTVFELCSKPASAQISYKTRLIGSSN